MGGMTPRVSWFWVSATIVLVVTIILGGLVAWSKYNNAAAIVISIAQPEEAEGLVYIDGGVTVPGAYPFTTSDSIATLVQAAGGLKDDASLSEVSLDVPVPGASLQTQRVNINRADVWLLQALPGIGETLANRIVDYRQQNGPFRHTSELTGVSGIGETLYEKIEDLITISD